MYEDPMVDLKGLIQSGSLQDYLGEFDVLSHKVTLSEYAFKLFFEWSQGRNQNPPTYVQPKAYALVRMQDSYLNATRTSKNYYNKPMSSSHASTQKPTPAPPFKTQSLLLSTPPIST